MTEQIHMANDAADRDDEPTRTPPGEYDIVVAYEGALQRHGFECAACDTSLTDGDAVFRNIWDSDYSPRSTVPLCLDCPDTDWREAVLQRRLDNAGRARGWIIETLWPYSTTTIRFATQVLAELALVTLVGIVLLATGWSALVSEIVSTFPLFGAGGVALVYLGHHALWVHRDPRGYTVPDRTPWLTLTLAALFGLVAVATSVTTDAGATPLAVVGVVLGLLVAAHEIGLTVRGDRSDAIVEPDRTAVVGGTRALTILGLAGILLHSGTWLGAGYAALPLLASLAYVVYRAPHDTKLQDQIRTLRDELDDLLNGGTY